MSETKIIQVERLGVRLRSTDNRRAARFVRRRRRDDEIIGAWLLRAARRMGTCPVDDPDVLYCPDYIGDGGWWSAIVRVLTPTTDWERDLFTGLRLESDTFRYVDQDSPSLDP